ncbi:MAG: hypothetical protein IJB11_05810, partial [Oscillospiraceae bacterium]|nr:hypothetical protein [Oscillospiraceae bacterium]
MKRMLSLLLAMTMLLGFVLPGISFETSAAAIENYTGTSDYEGLRISIIGDSISTFEGVSNSTTYNPLYLSTSQATFGTYYGDSSRSDYSEFSQVKRADTWWQQTVDTLGLELLVNNAWSGSYVLIDSARDNSTEYGAAAYKARSVNLHNGSKKPDIIAVYLGTNDIANYNDQDVGSSADVDTASERNALYKSVNSYSTPTSSIEAYYIMLSRMIATYPDAEIYCMLPSITMTTMSTGRYNALMSYNGGVEYLVDYFASNGKKVYLVDLNDDAGLVNYETVRNYYYCNNVHPDVAGMDWITNCLVSEIIEHSSKGAVKDTAYPVTYNLDNAFSTTGISQYAIKGKSFKMTFLPYETHQKIELKVEMNGSDVTTAAVKGDTVSISNVTGPITITAQAATKAHYSWEATTSGWASEFGYGYSYNAPTLYSGSYSYSTGSDGVVDAAFNDAVYTLDQTVVLEHTKPWVIEFEADGSGTTGFAGGTFIMSNNLTAKSNGNTYLYLDQTSLNMGYSDGSNYLHSGVTWATMAPLIGQSSKGALVRNDSHIYRLENVPNGSNNKIYLYVDGINVGTMDQYKKNSADISGVDFRFNYQGTSSFPLCSCTMSYLKVWENGEPAPTTTNYNNYRWETDASGSNFVNVTDGFDANGVTMLSGSLSNGVFTSATYALDQDVVLLHDKSWSIEWETNGNWTGGGMMFASEPDSSPTNNIYILRSSLIAFGCSISTQYNNYGINLSDYGINRPDRHVYRLTNRVNSDGSNMVYLYIDNLELGALNKLYVNGKGDGVASDWLNGQDFVFSYIGTSGHPVNDTELYYLQVSEGCTHDNLTWKTVNEPTCISEGEKVGTCTYCGK